MGDGGSKFVSAATRRVKDTRRGISSLKIEILRLGLDDLCADSALPLDDPHGLCRVKPEKLAAFRENPFRQAENEPVQLVGSVDGCAAGTLMFLPGEVVVGGKACSIAWCCGLYVVPEHRKSLLGVRLIKEAGRCYPVLGGSRVAEAALPIFKGLGWLDIPLTRYVLPCRSRPVLEHLLGPGKRVAVLSPWLDGALMLHRGLLKGRQAISRAKLDCRPADAMPETLDPALAELNGPFGCHRSSRWLSWILQHSFDADARDKKQLYLVHDRRDRVVAYFITRVKFHAETSHHGMKNVLAGSVLDWGILDASAVREPLLWLMATNTLAAEGVDLVEICAASPGAAVPWGFRKFGRHEMVLLSGADGPAICKDPSPAWQLRQIDGDSGLS